VWQGDRRGILACFQAGFDQARALTSSPVLCFADRAMFVTHDKAGSRSPMDVIGLRRAYG
jgi:hypothetical protein